MLFGELYLLISSHLLIIIHIIYTKLIPIDSNHSNVPLSSIMLQYLESNFPKLTSSHWTKTLRFFYYFRRWLHVAYYMWDMELYVFDIAKIIQERTNLTLILRVYITRNYSFIALDWIEIEISVFGLGWNDWQRTWLFYCNWYRTLWRFKSRCNSVEKHY